MSSLSISSNSIPYAGIDPAIDQDRKEFEEKIACLIKNYKRALPTNWEAYNPLQRAAALGQLDVCKKLLETGYKDFDQNQVDREINGLAAIILGCTFLNYEIVRFFFPDSPNKARVLYISFVNESPIFTELWNTVNEEEQVAVIEFLICVDAEIDVFKKFWAMVPPEVKNHVGKNGVSWIEYAIEMCRKEILDFLLDEVRDINFNFQNISTTPLARARRCATVLGQTLIDKIAGKDNGFTDDIERCIIFGHRLSLKGVFEGFDKGRFNLLSDQIIDSMKVASKSYECNAFLPSRVLQIEEAFEFAHSEPETAFERSFKHCTIVHSSWSGHRANCVFKDRVLVKIDTGTGTRRGLQFYHIKNPDQALRKAAMTTLFNNSKYNIDREIGSVYFHETIDHELDLEILAWLEIEQKVGNCAWSASKATLLAIMILQEADENSDPLDKDKIQKAYYTVKNPYVTWGDKDDIKDFVTPLKIIEKYPKIFDLHKIIDEIILNALEDGKELHIVNVLLHDKKLVNWQHPQTGKSLIRCCYEKRMLRNFAFLLGRVSIGLPDTHGKTLYDDYKDNPLTSKERKMMFEFFQLLWAAGITKETVAERAVASDEHASKYEKALIVYTPRQTAAEFIQSTGETVVQEVFRRSMELEKVFYKLTKTI